MNEWQAVPRPYLGVLFPRNKREVGVKLSYWLWCPSVPQQPPGAECEGDIHREGRQCTEGFTAETSLPRLMETLPQL